MKRTTFAGAPTAFSVFAVLVVAVAALPGSANGRAASTRTTIDATDAPAGPVGKTDLRSLTWDVGAATTTLTVSVDESTYGAGDRAELGVHVLLDTDGDAIADAEVTGARNANGVSMDMALRQLDRTLSTSVCQDLAGSAAGIPATVSTAIANGRESFAYTFDTDAVPGGLPHFSWAAFGQSPPDASSAGPWDYVPDGANPDSAPTNPGDRRCGLGNGGLRVDMTVGIDDSVRKPDGRIRLGTGAFVGNGVYNLTGVGQSRTGSAAPGQSVTFGISIQNDDPEHPDSFRVKATGAATSAYTVKYFRGSTDITTAVVAGTHKTTLLAPAAKYLITARVTVKSTAIAGSNVTRLVTSTSIGNSAMKDAVKLVGKRA